MAIDWKTHKPSDDEINALRQEAKSKGISDKEFLDAVIKAGRRTKEDIAPDVYFNKNGDAVDYDEYEAEQKADYFDNEMLGGATVDEEQEKIDDKIEDDGTISPGGSPLVIQALVNGAGKETAKKIIDWATTKGVSGAADALNATGKFAARNAGAIATGLISAYNTAKKRDAGKVKAEWKGQGDGTDKYLRDVGRNIYAYADDVLFGILPNKDYIYNNTKSEREEQAKDLQKNKEVKQTAKKLKEFNKTVGKLKGNEQLDAIQQMNNVAVKNNTLSSPDFQADFVKNNEWKTIKKKDGTTIKTWVNKETKEPVVGALNSQSKK